jgi:carboxyl-terminal processing protease
VAVDADMKHVFEDIAKYKSERKRNTISLNEAERRKERDAQEAQLASRDAAMRDDGLLPNERSVTSSLSDEKARKEAKDVFLQEAVRILGDALDLAGAQPRVAATQK